MYNMYMYIHVYVGRYMYVQGIYILHVRRRGHGIMKESLAKFAQK